MKQHAISELKRIASTWAGVCVDRSKTELYIDGILIGLMIGEADKAAGLGAYDVRRSDIAKILDEIYGG